MTTVTVIIKFHFCFFISFTLSKIHHVYTITIFSNFFWVLWSSHELENKDKACAKFWGVNKVYYGQCENGEYSCGDRLSGGDLVKAQTWDVPTLEILVGPLLKGGSKTFLSRWKQPGLRKFRAKIFQTANALPQSTACSVKAYCVTNSTSKNSWTYLGCSIFGSWFSNFE